METENKIAIQEQLLYYFKIDLIVWKHITYFNNLEELCTLK